MSNSPADAVSIPDDWFPGHLPRNIDCAADVYLDSTYAFDAFHSVRHPGLVLGEAAGVYHPASFMVGPAGTVLVGAYTILNGCCLIAQERIDIGSHCMLAWGVVVSDAWVDHRQPVAARRQVLDAAGRHPHRAIETLGPPRPVTIGDNVWVGFDSVVLPGVTIGRGAVIGCKVVIDADVPPYAVVVGSPPRIVRTLDPDDDEDARAWALQHCLKRGFAAGTRQP